MIVLIFIALAIIQWFGYSFFDRRKLAFGGPVTLVFVLSIYFILLPYIFYPTPLPEEENKPRCGMPIMAMYATFWFLGGALTVIVHLVYVLTMWIKKRKSTNSK